MKDKKRVLKAFNPDPDVREMLETTDELGIKLSHVLNNGVRLWWAQNAALLQKMEKPVAA